MTAPAVSKSQLQKALVSLVEQFEAYRNEWLGPDTWRDRIGLPADIAYAKRLIESSDQPAPFLTPSDLHLKSLVIAPSPSGEKAIERLRRAIVDAYNYRLEVRFHPKTAGDDERLDYAALALIKSALSAKPNYAEGVKRSVTRGLVDEFSVKQDGTWYRISFLVKTPDIKAFCREHLGPIYLPLEYAAVEPTGGEKE